MINECLADTFPDTDVVTPLARWHAAARPITVTRLLGSAQSLGVIVPHADDETLGCGGLIAAATARGLAVTVTVLTDGAASHPGSRAWPPARLARRRRREMHAAMTNLGDIELVFAQAPDGDLADHPDTADSIPPADLFVTCWQDDPHPDHRAAYFIARAAAARFWAPLLAFPLWVLTTDLGVPDLPLLRLDVTKWLPQKRAALARHRSQLGTLIGDVRGFVLDDDLQQLFVRPDELYLRCPPIFKAEGANAPDGALSMRPF